MKTNFWQKPNRKVAVPAATNAVLVLIAFMAPGLVENMDAADGMLLTSVVGAVVGYLKKEVID